LASFAITFGVSTKVAVFAASYNFNSKFIDKMHLIGAKFLYISLCHEKKYEPWN
jgi:hypothetical protein